MGKDAPDPPAPVVINAGQSASQQAAYNRDAAVEQRLLNMVDQYTPQGSTTYSPIEDKFSSAWEGASGREHYGQIEDPDNAGEWVDAPIQRFKATQAFSPEQQGLYDASTRLAQSYGDIGEAQLGTVRSSLEQPFSLAGLGAGPTADEASRQRSLEAILARHNPQAARQRAALETSLAGKGFVEGSEAYDEAFDVYNRGETDFQLAADISAGNEMAREFGLESSARDRAINEILMQRDQPLRELSSFMTGAAPTTPVFLSTPQGQIAAPDYMGGAYLSANQQNTAAQNTYNQNMGTYNANLQGLYGLGGSAIGAGGYKWGNMR